MRLHAPSPFKVTLDSPDGGYDLTFSPIDEWDGVFDVVIAGKQMFWPVTEIEQDEEGRVCFSGMTVGSEDVWNDQFFFQLWTKATPPKIEYWGDKIVWRIDFGIEVV
jgi:hypothetical protein